MFTLAHELTHFIAKWSKTQFNILADFVTERYNKEGRAISFEIRRRMKALADEGVKSYMALDTEEARYEYAREEVIADSMETMFKSGNVMRDLADLNIQSKRLVNKIRSFLKQFADKIRALYEKINPETEEGKFIAESKDAVEQLEKLFAKALKVSATNYAAAEKAGTIETSSDNVRFSPRDTSNVHSDISDFVDDALSNKKGTQPITITLITQLDNKIINRLGKQWQGKYIDSKRIITPRYIRHILNQHGDPVIEALRGQMHMDADAIKIALSNLRDGKGQIIKGTNSERGLPSILTEIPINGYTLYAEFPLSTSSGTEFEGRTIYMTPTSATAHNLNTRLSGSPQRRNGGHSQSVAQKSRVVNGFLKDSQGNESVLEFVETKNGFFRSNSATSVIPLSSNYDVLSVYKKYGKIQKAKVKATNPYMVTVNNAIIMKEDIEEGLINQRLTELRKKGYDAIIMDYKPGDNYMVMVFDKSQVVPIVKTSDENSSPNGENTMQSARLSTDSDSAVMSGRNANTSIANFDISLYNEIKISNQEMRDLQSEALTWDANSRNTFRSRTLSNGIAYLYIIDDDAIVHVYGRKQSKNIHEWGENYGNRNTEQLDTVAEELRTGQGNNGEYSDFSRNGREQRATDSVDNSTLRRNGGGNRGGYSQTAPYNHRKKKAVGYHFDDDGRITEITYSDGTKETLTPSDDSAYSLRNTPEISDRELLADALESVAENEIDRKKLRQYKEKIAKANELDRTLTELQAKKKALTEAKTKRSEISKVQDEITKTQNRITIIDKGLLNLESTVSLKRVLAAERNRVRSEARRKQKEADDKKRKEEVNEAREKQKQLDTDKYEKQIEDLKKHQKEIEARRKERANRTELRHKIIEKLKTLDRKLRNPTKDKHVPVTLQKPIAKFIAAISVDTFGADSMVNKNLQKLDALLEKLENTTNELDRERIKEQIDALQKSIHWEEAIGVSIKEKASTLKSEYEALANDPDPRVQEGYDQVVADMLKEVVDTCGDTPLRYNFLLSRDIQNDIKQKNPIPNGIGFFLTMQANGH